MHMAILEVKEVLANAPRALHLVNRSAYPNYHLGISGSSTGQADGSDSEVILKPCADIRDPFRSGNNSRLVLCQTYLPNGDPHPSNTRYRANQRFVES